MTVMAKQCNGTISAGEAAAALREARRRAAEQRLEVEALLNKARSIEEQLATETLQAEAAGEYAAAQAHREAAERAADEERRAAQRVEAATKHRLAVFAERSAVEAKLAAMEAERAAAVQEVAACEKRLAEARALLEIATSELAGGEGRRAEIAAGADAAVEAERIAADDLQSLRAARESHEGEARAAEERARALVGDAPPRPPSLAVIDELRSLESHMALSAEAARRAAERRAADAARAALRSGNGHA